MKRCNHPLCKLIAEAADKTCWLEAEDVPDPVRLLQAIMDDPCAPVLSESILMEVRRFLNRFEPPRGGISGEGRPVEDYVDPDQEVTDVLDVAEMIAAWAKSAEGDPV